VKKTVAGLRPWMLQRLTAVYMLAFILYFLAHFLLDAPRSHAAWRAWMLSPGISIAATVFMAALFLHTWVGVRDVILDYVHPPALRMVMLAMLGFCLLAMSAWAGRILLITPV